MLRTLVQRLGFPAVGPGQRRFVGAVAIDAVGSGVFAPVSMLYFIATTPLSVVQVGLAISIASLLRLPVGPALGGLVDRVGPRPVLLAGNLAQAVGYVAYLFVDSFTAVLLWLTVVSCGRTAFWSGYGNVVAEISRSGDRERWFGFLGALRNVGFAVGGLLAGAALTVGTNAAYHAIVLANAASYVAAFALIRTLPARPNAKEDVGGSWREVVSDRPYRALLMAQVPFALQMLVIVFALPVYCTVMLDLPGWIAGFIFAEASILVGACQGVVVNAMAGRTRWRMLAGAHLLFAFSFAVFWTASVASAVVAGSLIILGTAVYTLAELVGSPVLNALSAEAAPEHMRGRYMSTFQLTWDLVGSGGVAAFAFLLDQGAGLTWGVLVGTSLLGVVLTARLGASMIAARESIGSSKEAQSA